MPLAESFHTNVLCDSGHDEGILLAQGLWMDTVAGFNQTSSGSLTLYIGTLLLFFFSFVHGNFMLHKIILRLMNEQTDTI